MGNLLCEPEPDNTTAHQTHGGRQKKGQSSRAQHAGHSGHSGGHSQGRGGNAAVLQVNHGQQQPRPQTANTGYNQVPINNQPGYIQDPNQTRPQSADAGNSMNAQQNLFIFDEITFDSRFECGNLMHADQAGPGRYTLWIAPDNFKTQFETSHRVWFFFKVCNVNLGNAYSKRVLFKIANMNKHELNNYKNGMVPVCCGPSTNNAWQYIPTPLKSFKVKEFLEIEFEYDITQADSQQGVFFAFTFPYSYTECNNLVNHMEQTLANDPDVFFHRQVLAHSLEGRRIDILTITARDPSMQPGNTETEPIIQYLFPEGGFRPPKFRKRYVLLSCRVHPCETPANYMLQGFLLSLMNKNDIVTRELLQNFVFVVIPMLNPDGVVRGHYRSDTKGRDLNRVYHKALATPQEYPGPYGVMQIAKSLADGRLCMYLDLHAHSNKDSGFVFGNFTPNLEARAEIRLFARMFDMYSKNFDFCSCGFGQPINENSKNPKNMGIGKTEVGKYCGIFHCYTLESGYHKRNKDPERYTNNPGKDMKRKVPARIGTLDFCEIGDGLRHALLETFHRHPCSFVANTWYKSTDNTRKRIIENLAKEPIPVPKDDDDGDDDEFLG